MINTTTKQEEITMEIAIIAIVIVAVIAIWAIATTNGFKVAKVKIDEARSGIEVALTKRYDLLTKLLDVAKGYAKHEKEMFAEVINLRKGMSVGEMNEAVRKMDEMAKQINFTAEAYPELRSSEVFAQLQKGIFDAEEHLQAARRVYNSNVSHYNASIVKFPASLLAGGYTPEMFFEAEPSKREDVKMSF